MPPSLWGILQISDANRTVESVGQLVVFDAIQQFVQTQNTAVERAIAIFVGATVTNPEETFELPGGGQMQESDRLTRPAAVKRGGRYSIGYPLRDFRDQIAGDDITYAYMTLQQVQSQIQNIFLRYINTKRFHILKAFMNNANYVFEDETLSQRQITVRRLANTDGTIY